MTAEMILIGSFPCIEWVLRPPHGFEKAPWRRTVHSYRCEAAISSGVADCYTRTRRAIIGSSLLLRDTDIRLSAARALVFASTTLQALHDQTSSTLTWTLLPPQPVGSTLSFPPFDAGIYELTPGYPDLYLGEATQGYDIY